MTVVPANINLARLKPCPNTSMNLIVEQSPDRVVFEICSSAGWVYDIVKTPGIEVEGANPNTQACWRNVKDLGEFQSVSSYENGVTAQKQRNINNFGLWHTTCSIKL